MTRGFTGESAVANGYTVQVVGPAGARIAPYILGNKLWAVHSAMGMPCWHAVTREIVTGHNIAMDEVHLRRIDDPDMDIGITETESKEIYEKA